MNKCVSFPARPAPPPAQQQIFKMNGDFWSVEIPEIALLSYASQSGISRFEYKYFVSQYDAVQSNGIIRWEQGPNRLMHCFVDAAAPAAVSTHYGSPNIPICDYWEHKKVIIRLRDQEESPSTPSLPSLKVSFFLSEGQTGQVKKMRRTCKEFSTSSSPVKNSGDSPSPPPRIVVFWEVHMLVKNSLQSMKLRYVRRVGSQETVSRKPQKVTFSPDDVDFQGAYAFIHSWERFTFDYHEINEQTLIGPYPDNSEQVMQLKASGVRAVLNLQTEEDMQVHGIDFAAVQQTYREAGIFLAHFPVIDKHVEDMAEKLPQAVRVLRHLIAKYKRVYVHCTSGVYRSAQVIIAYLHLHEGFELNQAIELVEQQRPKTRRSRKYLHRVLQLTHACSML